LNRTCFNGLYRVNSRGLFNVPHGDQAKDAFFRPDLVLHAHRALRGATILCEDFEGCSSRVLPRDFVYLDPPYAASLNGGQAFQYQADGFGDEEQRRVAELFRRLDRQGAFVMASNADCPFTRSLYHGYRLHELAVTRFIGGRAERRGRAAEIVVTNYEVAAATLPGM
jgi:DNA adenine methylase